MITKSPKKPRRSKLLYQTAKTQTFQLNKEMSVFIDDQLSWKYHGSFVCSIISRNTGIFYKLHHVLLILPY